MLLYDIRSEIKELHGWLNNELDDARVQLLEVWEIRFIVWIWRLCDFIEIRAKLD